MKPELGTNYDLIRSGAAGVYEQKRGLIAVHGGEAVQFLDGLITNNVKALEDGAQMQAAFPNAQGRLLAVVRVVRRGDRYLFETEEATREKVYNNLFRFTFAGDFFVEDISDNYRYFSVVGAPAVQSFIELDSPLGSDHFVEADATGDFRAGLGDAVEIDDALFETLRIESGIPKYGVDMDENTIVPELGLDGLINYNKGCYIGQEIIARIHFRGHVAKRLAGLVLSGPPREEDMELSTAEGKNAGRITSVTYSPKLGKHIALGFVRYDFLAEGTALNAGETQATVSSLPFL